MIERWLQRRQRDERGSVMPFVVIVSLSIILLAALVIDGGRQLNGKGRAVAYAQEAARAGAQAIDVSDPRLDLVPALAVRAAAAYCQQAMAKDAQLVKCAPSVTTVNDGAGSFRVVRVTAQVEMKAILLSMIGKSTLTASGTAVARPVSGITEADSGKQQTVGPPSVAPPGGGTPSQAPTLPDYTIDPCQPSPTGQPTGQPSGQPTDPQGTTGPTNPGGTATGKPGKPGKPKPTKTKPTKPTPTSTLPTCQPPPD